MPIYDFRCSKCGHKFTLLTGMSERDKVVCQECGAKEVEQLITGCLVRTGSGCFTERPGSSGSRGG